MPGVFTNPVKWLSQWLSVVTSTARYSVILYFPFLFLVFSFPLSLSFYLLFAEEAQGMARPGELSTIELYFHLLLGERREGVGSLR